MAASKTLTARCLCRSVHFTITVAAQDLPLKAYLCHCSVCRYTHGSLCSFHSMLPDGVEPQFIAPSGLDKLTAYAHAQSQCTRYSCSTCGCKIGDRGHDESNWYMSSAIFDFSNDPSVWMYTQHCFSDSPDGGLAALVPSVGGRQMKVHKSAASQTPALSNAGSQPLDDTLLAQCHCGGVSFNISRPRQEFIDSPAGKGYLYPADKTKWLACLDFCDDCRLVNGTNVIGWMFVPLDHISPTPASDLLIGSSKSYRSSEGVLRTFCGTCGATVFFSCDERQHPPVVDIAMGLLRAREGTMAESWAMWRYGRVSWPESGTRFNADFAHGLMEGMKEWGRQRGHAEEFNVPP
ncbi:hypothetical protein N7474_002607 [Penicillium riverlandense]|uniref:uncharacterized protein n=1 Tax=Penicillium riverlandense TaxID=1903569 RepID=UPI002546D0A0|nr:uncharacterized protein N7474_002607 [Penicillium riverlandense]KAJ5825469.1 hypothetical protein N7474_002607 [Penicillium riverlandense]